ncbi:MAG: hypothetical protein EPO02_01270 [Nitrospirae bacterium]|nr:MAG: hypothetical protein EPO02_01270 [Nitrospirota bacterium]
MRRPLMRTVLLVLVAIVAWTLSPPPAFAKPFFSDGYLGLTQEELRAKLGPPNKVRTMTAALRIYIYYSFEEWEHVLREQLPDAVGEDVYLYVRDKTNVRYSFQYAVEKKPNSDTPALIVKLVEVEFLSPDPLTGSVEGPVAVPLAVPLVKLPTLVPEFRPSLADDAPAYRSNLFVILVQNEVSQEARRLIKDRHRDEYDWSLSYRLYTAEVLPSRLSLNDTMNRLEIAVDSMQLIKDHHKLTHEAMTNPYSARAASLPPSPEPPQKMIPKPRYAP